ncbi:ADP-ribose pyrophosphatase [Cloacibacillus sp. An23]|nr:ADP-ribose pyrophosphatase [Cloacibacillus sp. An23]
MEETKNPLRNIVKSEFPYKGRIIDVRVDTVKFPSGSEKIREVVLHRPAVAMLAEDADGGVYLVKQYRHAIDAEIYEIPAGLVEDGEDPACTAARELQEEIGLRPGRLEKIAEMYSSPGFTTEKITLYYAAELAASKLPEDEDEYIKVRRFLPDELDVLVRSGAIRDGKTLAAYYWLAARRGGR